jgi:hypothetical protein
MLDADTLLQQRFRNSRPGLELITIVDAALPVTVVRTDVLAQERKQLPLLDEFILRLSYVGLSSVDDIAGILGLEPVLVESTVADQVNSENLSYASDRRAVALTLQGKRTVHGLEAVQPVEKQFSVTFDRLSWALADYAREYLISKREAQDEGMLILPASKTSRVSPDDITVPGLNSLLVGRNGQKPRFEILSIRRLRPNTHRYLPVKLLVYGDIDQGEAQIGVSIDGDLSQEHEFALAQMGGAEKLGIHVGPPSPRPTLSPELEAIRVSQDEVAALRATTISRRLQAEQVNAASIAQSAPTSTAEQSLIQIPVRSVGVFEHRELLTEALEFARRRILLISPWIKSEVVNKEFATRLERRLRAGTVVHIAYGFGKSDHGSDEEALKRLRNLQGRYPVRFTFARLANTHAKILIFDDKWISTSFNWLSFRGDPDRNYRMEEGTLVQIPTEVTSAYERYVAIIETDRIDI